MLMFSTFATNADESEVLNIDRAISQGVNFSFPNTKNIEPKQNNFELINYVIMSNDLGCSYINEYFEW